MFRFRLAMALGMTVATLDRSMTTDELTHWRAFEQVEPFGSPALHWCAALITSVMANIHRNPKKSKAFKLADFLPDTRLHRQAAGQALGAKIMSFLTPSKKKAAR